jgi:hypothetical protein
MQPTQLRILSCLVCHVWFLQVWGLVLSSVLFFKSRCVCLVASNGSSCIAFAALRAALGVRLGAAELGDNFKLKNCVGVTAGSNWRSVLQCGTFSPHISRSKVVVAWLTLRHSDCTCFCSLAIWWR